MTKASDNAFPSLLITEGTEPSAPAAGKQRLYIDSTSHHLKRTNSSGTDVDIETAAGATPPDCYEAFGSADTAITAANTFTDLTGATLSLPAGTYDVVGYATAEDTNSAGTTVGLAIHDGSTQVVCAHATKDTGNGNRCHVTVGKRITLGGTTTVKLQGISTRGSSSTTFKKDPNSVFGVGPTTGAIRISATKVTAA